MPKYCNLESAIYPGVGRYGAPEIRPATECDADAWIGFNEVKKYGTRSDGRTGVHFFLHDYLFEQIWNTPKKYLAYLSRYSCVLAPDFSLYIDFPLAVSIYNHYRKHWLGRYWQEYGINVIPSVRWMWPDSYDWCFDGEPKNSVVAVSNLGHVKNKEFKEMFDMGYVEMLNRLDPKLVLFYGNVMGGYEGNVRYIKYKFGRAGGPDSEAHDAL